MASPSVWRQCQYIINDNRRSYHTPVTIPVALDCASTPDAARAETTEIIIAERILKDGKCEVLDICRAV
jgi:hypothetical protein